MVLVRQELECHISYQRREHGWRIVGAGHLSLELGVAGVFFELWISCTIPFLKQRYPGPLSTST